MQIGCNLVLYAVARDTLQPPTRLSTPTTMQNTYLSARPKVNCSVVSCKNSLNWFSVPVVSMLRCLQFLRLQTFFFFNSQSFEFKKKNKKKNRNKVKKKKDKTRRRKVRLCKLNMGAIVIIAVRRIGILFVVEQSHVGIFIVPRGCAWKGRARSFVPYWNMSRV